MIILKKENLVIIAPSYGEKNLLQVCGIELIRILLESNFRVLLRPHFRIFKDSKKLISKIIDQFGNNPNFILEEGIISSEIFNSSLCMISDWSGISFEYAFTFERPVIFIDVPKKILNPDSSDISLEPIEISYREKIGFVVPPSNVNTIPTLLSTINSDNSMLSSIKQIRSKTVYNIGQSAKIGAQFIKKLIE